jgi:predicted RNA-binding protein YlqC (UPF0109 family)
MKEMLEYIARGLVSDPEAVRVEEVGSGSEITLRLSVGSGDMGKVIGKGGRVAKEIRSFMNAFAHKEGVRVSVDILD